MLHVVVHLVLIFISLVVKIIFVFLILQLSFLILLLVHQIVLLAVVLVKFLLLFRRQLLADVMPPDLGESRYAGVSSPHSVAG